MDRRQHLRRDAGRLALPRGAARRTLAARDRLGDGRPPARRPGARLIYHTGRGCQYTAAVYRGTLAARGSVAATSRAGDGDDNALAGGCFATLKAERSDAHTWPTRAAARLALVAWIAVWSNRPRRHSALAYQPPAVFEEVVVVQDLAASR